MSHEIRTPVNAIIGLGMAITKRIVEMMNGTISVQFEQKTTKKK